MEPAIAPAPGVLPLAGRSFVILPPTPGDMLAVSQRMQALAQAKCVTPVDYAARHTHLPPAVFAILLSEAIKLGAGNGTKPHQDAVFEEYTSLEGVRWRVWYHASKSLKDLAIEDVSKLITPDNQMQTAMALDEALGFSEKKTPPGGTA